MNFHLVTLGCPKNTADSEGMSGTLRKQGWVWVDDPLQADVVFLNTCGFIQDAKEESLDRIMRLVALKEKNPSLKIIAFGCLIKRYHAEIAQQIPELDYVFDFFTSEEFQNLSSLLAKTPQISPKSPAPCGPAKRLFTPAHYGFLKIAEGCDNRCAYCAIPDIRGSFRSRPMEELLEEAEHLAASGARELIVVAQDTTRYGEDVSSHSHLPELLEELGRFDPVQWIRLQYLHPKRLSAKILDTLFSKPKVIPYFDIPFQHVSDRLLKLMNRGVGRKDLETLIKTIRTTYPQGIIRSTLIVGFPTETEQEFEDLKDFIESNPIDRLGAFAYSPEDGTPAALLKGKIKTREKSRRLDEIMTLQQVLASERSAQCIGKVVPAIVDTVSGQTINGRTYGDSPEVDNSLQIAYDPALKPGDVIRVKITSAEAYDFSGIYQP